MNKKPTPLQALEKIANIEMKEQYKAVKGGFVYRVVSDECPKELKIIETELKDAEKNKKVVEIIKREPSEVIEIITTYDIWEEYTKDYPISDRTIWHIIKNKSEFDLLKEVLK